MAKARKPPVHIGARKKKRQLERNGARTITRQERKRIARARIAQAEARRRSSRQRTTPVRYDPVADNTISGNAQSAEEPKDEQEPKVPVKPGKMIVERKIKLITEQHNIPKPSPMEGFPMKEWTIELALLDEAGKEKPARCFTKVVYNLHPSFENPVQTFHEPPFRCTNEGWGEFEMTIDCYTTEKGGKQTIVHDLNFASPTYENIHTVLFKNPSQALQAILRETGPLPSDEDRKARKGQDGGRKKKAFDVEKMADAIPRLPEDDLLHIIQLIHDHKTDETYVTNNIDAGEFSVDLYTISDNLGKLLWEFLLTTSEAHRLK